MTTAILDTNVLVQAVIGSPRASSARVVRAYTQRQFRLVFSLATLEEIHEVLIHPKIADRHGWSNEELRRYLTFLLANSVFHDPPPPVSANLTRDMTDTKFLALAQQSNATYLVTSDRRHLVPLRRFATTSIVTPAKFLAELPSATS
jgi:putative PIN family toxin of toxin-antitoxin system